jgi:hypothetical protein
MGRPRKTAIPAAEVLPRIDSTVSEVNDASAAPLPADSDFEKNKINRVSFAIKDDGSGFDFDGMQQRNKEKLAQLVSASYAEILEQGGMANSGAGIFDGVTLENIRTALDMLNRVNAMALKSVAPMIVKNPFKVDAKTGTPTPIAFDPGVVEGIFQFTEAQHAELDPRALRLAQKHSPEWLKKNADIVMLITMFTNYTFENSMKAISAQLRKDQAEAMRAVARQPDPAKPPTPPPGFNGGERKVVA